jgi:hypothetical protein
MQISGQAPYGASTSDYLSIRPGLGGSAHSEHPLGARPLADITEAHLQGQTTPARGE